MEKIINLIESVKGLKWYTTIILFFSVVLYSFNSQIVRLIDMEFTHNDVVINSLDTDIALTEGLEELLHDTSSDRAWIIRFHNGVTYYNGTHKSKMSCDYEVVRPGVSSEAQGFQDVPTGLYARWIKNIIDENMYVPNVNYMKDLRIKYLFKIQGVEAIAVLPYYRDSKLLALIGVDYTHPTTPEKLKKWAQSKETSKKWFRERIDAIGDLIP